MPLLIALWDSNSCDTDQRCDHHGLTNCTHNVGNHELGTTVVEAQMRVQKAACCEDSQTDGDDGTPIEVLLQQRHEGMIRSCGRPAQASTKPVCSAL